MLLRSLPSARLDFTTTLTKLKFVNADVIFFVGHENELGYMIKKAKQMGVKTRFLAAPGIFSPLISRLLAMQRKGFRLGTTSLTPLSGTDRMKAFGKRYKDRYGVLPSIYAANSYDSVMLYAAALRRGQDNHADQGLLPYVEEF